jgi:hypothetical protein
MSAIVAARRCVNVFGAVRYAGARALMYWNGVSRLIQSGSGA